MTPTYRHWYLAGWLHKADARDVMTVYDAVEGGLQMLKLAVEGGDLYDMGLPEQRRTVCLLVLLARQRTPDGEQHTELGLVRAEWRRCGIDDHHGERELNGLRVQKHKVAPHGEYLSLTPESDLECLIAVERAASCMRPRRIKEWSAPRG